MSTIIVAHNSLASLHATIPALLRELDPDDELIVVDSGSTDGLAEGLRELAPDARLLTAAGNVGFAAGANAGAAAAVGDVVVLLNPDAEVEPGWARTMRAASTGPWDGWMALVTMHGGAEINTSGGVLHFTGLGWAGQAGAAGRRRSGRRGGGGVPVRCMPGDGTHDVGGAGRLPRALLHVLRGRRPVAARPAARRAARGAAAGARRPRLPLRQGAAEVAAARAQPVGDDPAHLPAPRAAARDAGPCSPPRRQFGLWRCAAGGAG